MRPVPAQARGPGRLTTESGTCPWRSQRGHTCLWREHTCLWRCPRSSLRSRLRAGKALRLLRCAGAAQEESRREPSSTSSLNRSRASSAPSLSPSSSAVVVVHRRRPSSSPTSSSSSKSLSPRASSKKKGNGVVDHPVVLGRGRRRPSSSSSPSSSVVVVRPPMSSSSYFWLGLCCSRCWPLVPGRASSPPLSFGIIRALTACLLQLGSWGGWPPQLRKKRTEASAPLEPQKPPHGLPKAPEAPKRRPATKKGPSQK